MDKVKLIVHECFTGTRGPEEAFAAVFLSETTTPAADELTVRQKSAILKQTDKPQGSLCSMKGETNGTSED